MQKVVILFSSKDVTAPIYDKVWEDLQSAGYSHPKGLLSHVAYENTEGGIDVVDVWESADAFSEYGKVLVPLMEKTGVKLPEPKIIPAHNFIHTEPELV
jgi:hypothetical protein